jgi:glycosyltransferase involved in cell wall biosynthesis
MGPTMDKNSRPMKVLWFANAPGLSAETLKVRLAGSGWVPALQRAVEEYADCELGLAFYHDAARDAFELNKTWYFPIQRLGHTKKKRFLNRVRGVAEYDENVTKFLDVIARFKPDIIHIHGTEMPFGLILHHIRHIPVVISIQGVLTAYEKKYFSGIVRPGLLRQWRSGYPFFGADYRIWLKRAKIEQEIMRKTEFIFGRTDWDRRVSKAMAPQAEYFHLDEVIRPQFYQKKWDDVRHARDDVRHASAESHASGKSHGSAVLFTTSSASLYKGFETVIDTAAILCKNGIAFTWLVAGIKEGEALVKLFKMQKRVKDLGALHIRLLGTLSEQELADHFSRADIYIQVSHIENSPNSLCEAMLAGIPIIASYAGGTATLLQDKEQGVLYQDGDPYSLAGCIQEMLDAPEPAAGMAEAAYRVAHRRHDPGVIVREMMDRYAEMIAKKG